MTRFVRQTTRAKISAGATPYIKITVAKSQQSRCDGLTPKRSPACRQLFEATQHKGRPPFRILGVVEPQIRQATQQGCDRDLSLDACKLGAEAKVNAPAKGQRTHIGAGDIETIRPVRIDRRVAIGGTQQA